MQTVIDLSPRLGVRPLCDVLSVSSATYYRHRCLTSSSTSSSTKRFMPRALTPGERHRVLDVLHEPRFVDLAPAEVYATLLDEGTHLCSERTMYRVLAENEEVRERRAISRHTHYTVPELLATKPNELWRQGHHEAQRPS